MTRTRAALIVSHGQPSDPGPAEEALAQFAARVAEHLPGWHVGAATLAQPGALDAALAAAGEAPRVYPLFMTEGWFTGENLRNRLAGAPDAEILRPLGVSPHLPALAAERLGREIAQAGWTPGDTRAFADALGALLPLAEIRTGFVEEAPFLADAARGLGTQSLCLPFFAAAGGHVVDDIPEALDAAGFRGRRLAPLGLAPAVPALVAREIGDRR